MSAPAAPHTVVLHDAPPTAALNGLFTLSSSDLIAVRKHFADLDPAEFGWIVDGIDAEMAERANEWRER